jgi:hypothetical protein
VLVNDSPQTLDGCRSGPRESSSAEDIGSWLSGGAEVVGDYGTMCQVDYSNSTDILNIYSS